MGIIISYYNRVVKKTKDSTNLIADIHLDSFLDIDDTEAVVILNYDGDYKNRY